MRVRIEPLGVEEAIDYLLHHLRAAGGRPEAIFTEECLELLARGTRGIPRLLNQAAHQALALTFELQTEAADAEVAIEVLNALGLGGSDEPEDEELVETAAEDPSAGAGGTVTELLVPTAMASAEQATEPEVIEIPDSAHDVLAYRLYDPPRQPA